ncbi:MAG: thioredoxin family protein [Pirellula sp.]|jgi:peroxiredoxin
MVKTASTMLPLGTLAPDFRLPNIDGSLVSLDDVAGGKALVVVFMCNHCPFVKHVAAELVRLSRDYASKGVKLVGISSNDVSTYPDDSPEAMKEEARVQGYDFPYLYDETQEVAQSYRAACTPDFFVFDAQRKLAYRGQLDDSRPKNGIPVTGKDLRNALDLILSGQNAPTEQRPSIGCNIKWHAGKEPSYFNPSGVQ